MNEGSTVELQMEKVLKENEELDESVYSLKVIRYEKETETLYLVLEQVPLTALSLDAVYECRSFEEDGGISCEGVVQSRYQNFRGNIVEFRVENGFYKNNIK